MRCPYCGVNDDKVIDSRAADGGASIRRRRQCLGCSKRFTTYEVVETTVKLAVIKKDGSRVPYDKQKMLAGLQKACYKRQVSVEQLQAIVEEVEEELFRLGSREVPSEDIGQLLADRLRQVDQVAYVRFASVYRQFRDLEELFAEVREVMDTSKPQVPGQGKLF